MDAHYNIGLHVYGFVFNVFLIRRARFQNCAAKKQVHFGFKAYPYP